MIAPATLVGLVLLAQVPAPRPATRPPSALRAETDALRAKEADALDALCLRLADAGKAEAAKAIKERIEPAPPRDGPVRFVPLPEVVPAREEGPEDALPAEARMRCDGTATALFELAGRAAAAGEFALADDCLRGVLRRQPDHPEARRLLGYVPHNGGWATPFAVERFKDGLVPHPTYGWVFAEWVPHLERGELPAPSTGPARAEARWLPADEADALRRDFRPPWQIPTEHFFIATNVSLSQAISFGRRLEDFHDLFFALMADILGPDLPLARRFAGKPFKADEAHRVFFFASQQEFIDRLLPRQGPNIRESLGVYQRPKDARRFRDRPASYFFNDIGGQLPVTATLYHEVSHQLLFETVPGEAIDRNAGQYWVFEGLGTYFETVTPQADGALLVGGLVGPRIEQAKLRLIDRDEFVPIERLVGMDMNGFNELGDVYLHYAEAMALTVFLMHADGAAYRDNFLAYVRDAYRGRIRRASGNALDDRLGLSYATLNERFLAWLKEGGEAKPSSHPVESSPSPSGRGPG